MPDTYSASTGPGGASYKTIARRIGMRLKDVYENPEAEPLPADHVDLLLRLRHKERERVRRHG